MWLATIHEKVKWVHYVTASWVPYHILVHTTYVIRSPPCLEAGGGGGGWGGKGQPGRGGVFGRGVRGGRGGGGGGGGSG